MTAEGRRRFLALALALLGLALIGFLLRDAGPARVAQVLVDAAWWLPLIVALELVQISSDVVVLRMLLGPRAPQVPAATWVRSSSVSYAMMILLPAGRAAGEVTRGAMVAQHVGASRAATVGAQLQASYLMANGVLSAVAFAAVASWWGLRSPLSMLLAGNTLLMAVFTTCILAVLRGNRAGRWLEQLRERFAPGKGAPQPPLEPGARRRVPWDGILVCSASRAVQVVQYGVILAAVGGAPSVHGAFVAHGIHLVGTTAGDLLPNQLGAVDGAYRAFASAVGFSGDPARALSIAFVAHTTQLLCAAGGIVVALVSRRAATRPARGPASAGADARS